MLLKFVLNKLKQIQHSIPAVVDAVGNFDDYQKLREAEMAEAEETAQFKTRSSSSPTRKIVQISATEFRLYAFCDDGSIWIKSTICPTPWELWASGENSSTDLRK